MSKVLFAAFFFYLLGFKVIAEGPDIVIHQPEKVLDVMEEWPRQTFIKNGLVKKIRESSVNLEQAEKMVGKRRCQFPHFPLR